MRDPKILEVEQDELINEEEIIYQRGLDNSDEDLRHLGTEEE